MPFSRNSRRTSPKPGGLLGTVLSWGTGVRNAHGSMRGGGAGTVQLDDGRTVRARWSGAAMTTASMRPTAEGQRVRLEHSTGAYRATLIERESPVASTTTTPPPMRAPLPSLSPTLARAIAAALAAGESPWTIAARHGIAVEQVR